MGKIEEIIYCYILHIHSFTKLQILIHNYTYSTAFLRMRLFISVIISAVVGVQLSKC